MNRGVCWLDGKLLPLDQACLPVLDHGLLYGDGVFEGIRFYAGVPFLLREHLRRLRHSGHVIALDIPWEDDQLAEITMSVVDAFEGEDGYIRMIVTRGDGPLGIDPAPCSSPRLIVIASDLEMVNHAARGEGVRLITAATRRLPPDGLDPRIDGALPGITRALILQLADEMGIEACEQSLAPYDLYTADECFLTGTGAELIPVRDIDGRAMKTCPGPVFQCCNQAFRQAIRRHCGGETR